MDVARVLGPSCVLLPINTLLHHQRLAFLGRVITPLCQQPHWEAVLTAVNLLLNFLPHVPGLPGIVEHTITRLLNQDPWCRFRCRREHRLAIADQREEGALTWQGFSENNKDRVVRT